MYHVSLAKDPNRLQQRTVTLQPGICCLFWLISLYHVVVNTAFIVENVDATALQLIPHSSFPILTDLTFVISAAILIYRCDLQKMVQQRE